MSDITLHVAEPDALTLHYVEAKIKPEQTKSVTPAYAAQTVLPDAGMTLGQVNVAAIPEPTDTLEITENGEYHVERIGIADVNVPQGVFPEGTIELTENNTTADVTSYANARVAVNTDPEKGFVFDDFDENGYPQTVRVVGFNTIPIKYMYEIVRTIDQNCNKNLKKLDVTANAVGLNAFGVYNYNHAIIKEIVIHGTNMDIDGFTQQKQCKKVTFDGVVTTVRSNAFYNCTSVELYDFSKNGDTIATLQSAAGFYHASGCVIRVPQLKLTEWQNETNWNALTDVVWEGRET